jgi:FkbH-like protein
VNGASQLHGAGIAAETGLRLSRFASIVPAEPWWIVVNLSVPTRLVVDAQVAQAVAAFTGRTLTMAQFAAGCPEEVDAQSLLSLLLDHGIVVEQECDEVAAFGELIATGETTRATDKRPRAVYQTPRALRAADLPMLCAPGEELRRLEVLLVGGCVVAFAQDTLTRQGRQRGFSVRCRHRWPSTRGLAPLDADGVIPDLVLLQPSIQPFLASVWDEGPFQSSSLRARHTRALARLFARAVEDLASRLEGGLGLVHNVAPPAISPFGRLDFRTRANYREITTEINTTIDAAAARHENILVVDEERLALRHGGAQLFDDLVFPFGHHGGAADPQIAQPHQLPELSEVLASEYLACYEVFHGFRRIRCVALDLDGVLWPQILAEDGMGWIDSDTTTRWVHQGLHQALRLLKARGILLVSLSKGSLDMTLDVWRRSADPRLLSPEDFVLHSIDWTPKPERLRSTTQRLGLRPQDVLFLDDNPVERAEMRARLPDVQIVEGELASFRAQILSDPRCEVAWRTSETARRTETTKVVLEREALRATLPAEDFLASLDVHVAVDLLRPAQRARAFELLARTTQFNTLGRLLLRDEAARLIARPGVKTIAVTVRDRFAEYGLCGIVVMEPDAVAAAVLSCRVIGLDVAVAMLVGSLRRARLLRAGTRASVIKVSRNAPCHDLFLRAGFTQRGEDRFEIVDVDAVLRSGQPGHITVTIGGDAEIAQATAS